MKMRVWLTLVTLTWLAAAAAAQNSSIQGTVLDKDGKTVDGAPVQARNPETGATLRTVSAANGSYTLAPAAPGAYTLSVAMPGFTYLPFTQSGVAVSGAAPRAFRHPSGRGNGSGNVGRRPRPCVDSPPPARTSTHRPRAAYRRR